MIKKIWEYTQAKLFCVEPERIHVTKAARELYEKCLREGVEPPPRAFHCHHRLEIGRDGATLHSKQSLIDLGLYYGREPEELEIMTNPEHGRLHNEGDNNLRYWKDKHRSPETRAKISASKTGKKRGPMSEEWKAKLSAANKGKTNPNKGKKLGPLSVETKAKISASKTGKKRGPMSEEWKAKISAGNKGKTLSEETRAKISATKKGDNNPMKRPEVREKQRVARKAYWARRKAAQAENHTDENQ